MCPHHQPLSGHKELKGWADQDADGPGRHAWPQPHNPTHVSARERQLQTERGLVGAQDWGRGGAEGSVTSQVQLG